MDPDVDPRDLDAGVRAELRGLTKETADRVARHLVVAGQLIDDDPERALSHTQAARALAGRVASVREAVGIAAYRAGEFGEALAELRAARRISGRDEHLPVMADCERALGRPDRALALIASPAAQRLDRSARVELRIVESGVRRDLGQAQAAVLALQGPELDSTRVETWTARLWYAYAAALLDAGRREDALQWFHAVTTVDDGETDADERVAELDPEEAADLDDESADPGEREDTAGASDAGAARGGPAATDDAEVRPETGRAGAPDAPAPVEPEPEPESQSPFRAATAADEDTTESTPTAPAPRLLFSDGQEPGAP